MRALFLLGLCALVALPHQLRADAFADGARAAMAGDYGAAFGHWLPLAEAGDADAQYNLGNLLDRGLGRAEDDAAAAEWYRRAAGQGVVEAMVNLGLIHEIGRAGVARDPAEAARWYEQAGAAGNALAQYKLGEMYSTGTGVPQDFARAAEWYERAVRQDLAAAMYRLGTLYAMGQGVEKDASVASELYERGETTTCMIRGHEYEPLAMRTARMSVFFGG
jgi:TPR repeat protein